VGFIEGEGDFWGLNPEPKHALANSGKTASPVLPSVDYKWGAISLFAKLLWSLFTLSLF